jgi:hypothetical protein
VRVSLESCVKGPPLPLPLPLPPPDRRPFCLALRTAPRRRRIDVEISMRRSLVYRSRRGLSTRLY